jgi:putative membrane protein insertion efficiency factor
MRFLLKIYKMTISPLLKYMFGGGCKYKVTCSEYTVEVIEKYGIIKGTPMAIKRIINCR